MLRRDSRPAYWLANFLEARSSKALVFRSISSKTALISAEQCEVPSLRNRVISAYTLFRRFLLQDGYDMLQCSDYSRIVNGEDGVKKVSEKIGI